MSSRRRFLKTAAILGISMTTPSLAGGPTSARAAGFRQPEESEPHLRTFMQWPVSRAIHADPVFLGMLQQSIADIANTVAEFEPVVMLMSDRYRAAAQRLLASEIEIWDIATDDLWCRDSGPLFVTNRKGNLAVSHLNFNGWGGKQIHPNDGKIAAEVADRLGLTLFDNGIVGEAGGVETDGDGTLIAHTSSWVNPNRDTGSHSDIERKLLEALGAEKMIWAPGIAGADITDYHIDSLARFVQPGTVAIQMPEAIDPNDPWSAAAFETFDILSKATDARGQTLEIVKLPEPRRPRITAADFVASYVNYYVCNGAVIAAQFGDQETDIEARAILQQLYPDHEVVALNVDPIGEVGGGIHCATQQQPRG